LCGEFSTAYRKQLNSISFKKRACLSKSSCISISFGVASITISCDEFRRAIYETILARDNIKVSELSEDAKSNMDEVITYIFEAAEKHGGSDFDLFIFTSIAMFNHNSFTRFPSPNTDNEENRSRGLLQVKSEKYYRVLKSIGQHDYVKKRYLLDSFTAVTIEDEFKLYIREFAAGDDKSAASMMRHTIIRMASFEGQALEEEACRDIGKIANRELREKLQNRFSILDYLLFYMAESAQKFFFTNE